MRVVSESRRRFRWSLRTMFVVVAVVGATLGCVRWVLWNRNLVHQRKALDDEAMSYRYASLSGLDLEPLPQAPTKMDIARRRDREIARLDISFFRQKALQEAHPTAPPQLSWLRTWLGDQSIEFLAVYSEADFERAKRLFPEALICYMP